MKHFFKMTIALFSLIPSMAGAAPMKLSSPDGFYNNAMMPLRFTCNGRKITPPLEWKHAPKGTKSFAIICEDPDAPNAQNPVWDHWIVYNIPGEIREMDEGADLPKGAKEGLNSWGKTGYGAPCPPDREHRYIFKLYALDQELEFANPPHKKDLLKAMEGHILAEAELVGRYNQPQNR